LDKGRLLYDGSRTGFEERYAAGRSLVVALDTEADEPLRGRLHASVAGDGVELTWETPRRLRVECARATSVAKVTALVLEQLAVADLTVHGAELDAIVTRLYRSGKAAT